VDFILDGDYIDNTSKNDTEIELDENNNIPATTMKRG
jgi:hypothetical protein